MSLTNVISVGYLPRPLARKTPKCSECPDCSRRVCPLPTEFYPTVPRYSEVSYEYEELGFQLLSHATMRNRPLRAFAAVCNRKVGNGSVRSPQQPHLRLSCLLGTLLLLDVGRNASQGRPRGLSMTDPYTLVRKASRLRKYLDVVGPFHVSFRGSPSSFARKRTIRFLR